MKKKLIFKNSSKMLIFFSISIFVLLFNSCKEKNRHFKAFATVSIEALNGNELIYYEAAKKGEDGYFVFLDSYFNRRLEQVYGSFFRGLYISYHIDEIEPVKEKTSKVNVVLLEKNPIPETTFSLLHYFYKINDNLENIYLTESQIINFILNNPNLITENNKLIFLSKGFSYYNGSPEFYYVIVDYPEREINILLTSYDITRSSSSSSKKSIFVVRK